ncbi:MAG TPA: TIGR04282 family arsenosugar biosynthesis glycosyltransferase [Allosphingosinicella sp.]
MTRILIFAKEPVPGQAKTRLIPALGADGAAALASEMLERTVEAALATGLEVELCGDPDPHRWYSGPTVSLHPQGEGDLGARLARAAERVIAGGKSAILIGTDCPDLDACRLGEAAAALERYDGVIHPTIDGGYALLGLRRSDPSIFGAIDWSTDRVARQTTARLTALGWSLRIGETLRDIDEPADLEALAR